MQIDKKLIRETNAYSCLECGKCAGTCPVSRYSHTFSPRKTLIRSTRNIGTEIPGSADLWSCLTCQQCDEICPSDIKYIELTRLLRQFAGSEKREETCSHGGILQSISRIMAAGNLKQERLGWMDSQYQTSASGEYLYFMGCLPYYDVLFSENGTKSLNIARSTLKILNYFNIKPQVLANEKCCGHDFYWNGDQKNFMKLAEANLELIKKSGAKKIITSCPECYRTLRMEYRSHFGSQPYIVQHISEFLAERLEKEKIEFKGDNDWRVTFQDPCRLGRHLGIYEPPRKVLKSLSGLKFQEMAHHHNRGTCCGVVGWKNCSQVSKQIQVQRLREAKAAGANTLITTCPKCQIHFQCALADTKVSDEIDLEVLDLTEVFAKHLK